jgi:hypothetical protein
MNIALTAAFLFALVTPVMAGAEDVVLTPGKFTTDGKIATQLLTAKNNGSEAITILAVECGFLKGAELVSTGKGSSLNVDTGQTAYLKVTTDDGAGADHVDCRVVGAAMAGTFKPPPPRPPAPQFKPDMFLNPPSKH